MGRKNRRKGGKPVDAGLIEEMMGAKPSQPLPGSDCKPGSGPRESLCEETAADRAYARAVAVCDRLVAELEKELRRDDHAED